MDDPPVLREIRSAARDMDNPGYRLCDFAFQKQCVFATIARV
jgi:hypothetical protein